MPDRRAADFDVRSRLTVARGSARRKLRDRSASPVRSRPGRRWSSPETVATFRLPAKLGGNRRRATTAGFTGQPGARQRPLAPSVARLFRFLFPRGLPNCQFPAQSPALQRCGARGQLRRAGLAWPSAQELPAMPDAELRLPRGPGRVVHVARTALSNYMWPLCDCVGSLSRPRLCFSLRRIFAGFKGGNAAGAPRR